MMTEFPLFRAPEALQFIKIPCSDCSGLQGRFQHPGRTGGRLVVHAWPSFQEPLAKFTVHVLLAACAAAYNS